MNRNKRLSGIRLALLATIASAFLAFFSGHLVQFPDATADGSTAQSAPVPLLEKGHPVAWWFVFKFNTASFPGCADGDHAARACPFGGDVQTYKFSQQYVYASSDSPTLRQGGGCLGATTTDPVGATFDEVYNGAFYYLIWNDQFYDDPVIHGCTKSCGAPWGHSKGLLAWNEAGEGLVLQVTTPSWPAAGSKDFPRQTDGNTLGCVKDDNVMVSQDFFALKLTKDDVVKILQALQNASVVTDATNRQIVNDGGPADVQALVKSLGTKSHSHTYTDVKLSSGVELISKPSALHVPPWQMVSAALHGVFLRAATWWEKPYYIPTTTASTPITCWDDALDKPGAVEIATTGQWNGKEFGLKGGSGTNFNHAKIGVSTSGNHHYAIFGDMNQEGALTGKCASSQNGRGGLFYVIDNPDLSNSVANLIKGDTAPTEAP